MWVGARGAEHVSAQGGGRNDGRGGARGIVGDGVDPEAFRRAAGAAVGHFARRLGAKVVVLPFHPALDRSEAYEFARVTSEAGAESVVFDPCDGESGDAAESDTNRGRTWGRGRGETGQVDHRRLLALVGGMDLLLCVRFHGLVFSALSGRPAVAVAYDPKVHHLAESLGVPWLVPGVDSSLLTQALVEAWEQRETLSKALFERAEEFRTRAFAEGVRALACAKGQGARAVSERSRPSLPSLHRVDILGVGVDVVTAEEAVHRIAAFWRSGGSHQVVTLNPEMIMAARRDAALRGILRECSLVVADGIGVVWASALSWGSDCLRGWRESISPPPYSRWRRKSGGRWRCSAAGPASRPKQRIGS